MSVDISYISLLLCLLLLIIPILSSYFLKLKLIKPLIISVSRMIFQLFLVGIFLEYIFEWNNPFINILWVLLMIVVATFTVISRSELNIRKFYFIILIAFTLSNIFILFYFNFVILKLDNIADAKYLIAIGGMIIGNCLRAIIIGISHFYENIKNNINNYNYTLSLGASRYEALLPYIRKSLNISLKPTIANISTVGLVSLPGMMTGQILGGADPSIAIKYQIAIMIAIFVSTTLTTGLTILFSINISFDSYDNLKDDIFHIKS